MDTEKINAVANEFLEISNNQISLLQLLKLCYIAQGFSLAILDRTIFDDDIEAWKYGPVIPALYHEFKHFRAEKITKKSKFLYIDNDYNFIEKTPFLEDNNDKKIIKIVWNLYGKYSGSDLVNITHKRGTPWDLTYLPNANKVISQELIKKYYQIITQKMKENAKH